MIAAVVLAAGAGTRLRPLTHYRPKALCPVNNVPLVDLALDDVASVVADVAVNIHHGREQLEPHLAGRAHLSIEEREPLGTAGAIGALRDWLAGRAALIRNADAWRASDLTTLLSGWDGERVRLLVTRDDARGDFGPWRVAGASLLPWRIAQRLSARPTGLYEVVWRAEHAAGRLELVRCGASFFDCGTPADYLRANLAASGGDNVVAPDAIVEGELVRSVVWPGGRVARGERLVEAVRVGADVTVSPFAVGDGRDGK